MVNVEVDQSLCVMCGMCIGICPEVFEEGDSGKARVVPDSDKTKPCVKEAEEGCPVEAIMVTD